MHLFQELGADVSVFRNDAITVEEAEGLEPSHLLVSPARSTGRAGISVALIRRLGPRVPTLGVCLGHQAIVEAFGGEIGQARRFCTERRRRSSTTAAVSSRACRTTFDAGRYHSLAATTVPDELEVSARTADGEVMAVRHRTLPIDGVQFHPGVRAHTARARARHELPRDDDPAALAELLEGQPLGAERAAMRCSRSCAARRRRARSAAS